MIHIICSLGCPDKNCRPLTSLSPSRTLRCVWFRSNIQVRLRRMLIETPKDICCPMGVWIEWFDTIYPGKSNFQVIGLICCGQLFLQIYVFSLGIIRDQNHTDLAHYQALRKIPKLRIQTSGEFLVVWVFGCFVWNQVDFCEKTADWNQNLIRKTR